MNDDILGIVIGVTQPDGRMAQVHITSPAKDSLQILKAAMEDRAKRVVEDLFLRGVGVRYVHFALIAQDRKSYQLIEELEV